MTNEKFIKHIIENSENEVIYAAEITEEGTIYLSVDCTEDIYDIKEIFKGVANPDTLEDNLKLVSKDKKILTNIIEINGEYFQIIDYTLYGTTCSNCELSLIEKDNVRAATYTPLHILKNEIEFY